MKEKIFYDMKPKKKRLVTENSFLTKINNIKDEKIIIEEKPKKNKRHRKLKAGFKSLLITSLIILSVIVIIFASALILQRGTIIITPNSKDVVVDSKLTAYRDIKPGILNFEIMTIKDASTTTLDASIITSKETKAQGQITIFNSYSPAKQTLVAGTKVQNSTGKIYKLLKTVVVPGTVTVSGKKQPGSISTTVVAELSGSSYNMRLTDSNTNMTLPVFATNKAKFDAFTVKLKTDVTGGGSKNELRPTADAEKKAKLSMDDNLKTKLLELAKAQIPEGYVFFDNSLLYTFETVNFKPVDDRKVEMVEQGTANIPIFSKDVLARYLIKGSDDSLKKSKLNYSDIETLIFNYSPSPKSLQTDKNIIFTLKGKFKIMASLDQEKIKNSFAGKSKADISTILINFPEISKTEIISGIFWTKKLPNSPSRIDIEVINSK
ncbi:MAG: hypothetical protein Q7R78_00010 [bacterium]|nr:hypothetical protein [bacterium]